MSIRDQLADEFQEIERLGENVIELHLSKKALGFINKTSHCETEIIDKLWGAKIIFSDGNLIDGEEIIIKGEKGSVRKIMNLKI